MNLALFYIWGDVKSGLIEINFDVSVNYLGPVFSSPSCIPSGALSVTDAMMAPMSLFTDLVDGILLHTPNRRQLNPWRDDCPARSGQEQNQESKNMTSRANSYSNPSIPHSYCKIQSCFIFLEPKVNCLRNVSFRDPAKNSKSSSALKLPVFLQAVTKVDGCNLSKLETRKVNTAGS